MTNQNDTFTDGLKLFIDNEQGAYYCVMHYAHRLIEDGEPYPAARLADFIEEQIFDGFWNVDKDDYSLAGDMRELVRCEIDFDGLARGYLDDAQETMQDAADD